MPGIFSPTGWVLYWPVYAVVRWIPSFCQIRMCVKPKKKVGKRQMAPMNRTDTKVSLRSINMPSQSTDKEVGQTDAVTHRNLSVADLLGQLRHYRGDVRRDALGGLLELCTEHPRTIGAKLGPVVFAREAQDLPVRRKRPKRVHVLQRELPLLSLHRSG